MIEIVRAGRGVTRRVEPEGQLAKVRKQLVVTERWDARVEEWRSTQRPLPTWSEAVRVLVEEALDAREKRNGKR
ncbi:hypothetical protein [Methylobacterium sp. CM6247]